jgi:hypothetical protein
MGTRSKSSGSYSVVWRQPDGSLARGGLLLEPEALLFRGTAEGGDHVARRIRYADLAGMRIDRESSVRRHNQPTLLLERRDGDSLTVDVIGAGLLWELADLLALILSEDDDRERVVVVAGVKEGMRGRLQALIAEGPPFDVATSGLSRHEVLLAEDSVVFLFQGPQITATIERLMQAPELWQEAPGWEACLAGPPQLAEVAYAWTEDQESTVPQPTMAES